MRETDGEIVAFSDANATWAPDALRRLVRNFADPDVAYVCGQLHARARRRLEPRGRRTGATSSPCAPPSRGSARSPAATARSTPCAASDYVEVDPRFGHDLSLPVPDGAARPARGLRARRAVAFEKPTPTNEAEYRRKVRMFEHCWLIVLRGKMLRAPAARSTWLEIVSHRHLRYGERAAAPRPARDDRSRSSREGSVYDVVLAAQLVLLARGGARRRDRALLRARHLGDGASRSGTTCVAACPRPGR